MTGRRPGLVLLSLLESVSQIPSPEVQELLQKLDTDRSWLLQQIDSGRWPELRLDLAALERELGQLIIRASELEDEVNS
ncbi:hypothetical protein CREGCYN_06610 [Synechococcus sp. M16CYN]